MHPTGSCEPQHACRCGAPPRTGSARASSGKDSHEAELNALLLDSISVGNPRLAATMIATGAKVDGDSKVGPAPIILAAYKGDAFMIELLIKHGANIEARLPEDLHNCDGSGPFAARKWGRATHVAAMYGRTRALRALVKEGADLNAGDSAGHTPLELACTIEDDAMLRLAIVQELLDAGANPALANEQGRLPLHLVASLGCAETMALLMSKAPNSLNHVCSEGFTPLFFAAYNGRAGLVAYLLAAGTTNKAVYERLSMRDCCPLLAATQQGHEGVVRLLLSDRGLEAVGGSRMIPFALSGAVSKSKARIMHMLLRFQGERKKKHWATCACFVTPMLHLAAQCCTPTCASVLLAAGARETIPDPQGWLPRYHIGLSVKGEKDMAAEKATLRVLERGPAFRARSWLWPARASAGGGSSDAGAAAGVSSDAGTAGDALSLAQARKPSLGVRIFRPRRKSFFVDAVAL